MKGRQLVWGVVLLLGCAPQVRTTMLGAPAAPEPAAAEVLVFSARVPDCPFEEIALISAAQGGWGMPGMDDVLQALRERARRLGGHAIVGLTERAKTEQEGPSLVGTVVRFTSEECRPRRSE